MRNCAFSSLAQAPSRLEAYLSSILGNPPKPQIPMTEATQSNLMFQVYLQAVETCDLDFGEHEFIIMETSLVFDSLLVENGVPFQQLRREMVGGMKLSQESMSWVADGNADYCGWKEDPRLSNRGGLCGEWSSLLL